MAFEGYVTDIVLDFLSNYPRKKSKRILILNDILIIIDKKSIFLLYF